MSVSRPVTALLPGLAAALGVAAFAQAAELPNLKAPPPRPARACAIDGMKGFVAAGSETCVRISGYISAGVEAGGGRAPAGGAGAPRN